MPRKAKVFPSYLLHRPTGQARVRLNGRDVYLGPYGSEESRVRYGELIAKLAGGVPCDPFVKSQRSLPHAAEPDPGPTVGEICLVFLRHAERHYRKNGKLTGQFHVFKSTIRPLNELYGLIPASEFGPLALKAVRARMIELGWCRKTVNEAMGRIRRIFKHAIENELIDSAVLERLKCVAPLLFGRTEAPDYPPRTAVDPEHIEAVRGLVSPLVRDLIDLQLATGARSGELLQLTSGMIYRSGDVWFAELSDHKTRHLGKGRILWFGPKSQLILTKYLSRELSHPLFSIIRTAYCRAITRACERAGIPRWVPHQLRHTNAHIVREEFGLEHAQATLGHAKADMTQHYAKVSNARAAEVARKIG